jgi:hypothetical protein
LTTRRGRRRVVLRQQIEGVIQPRKLVDVVDQGHVDRREEAVSAIEADRHAVHVHDMLVLACEDTARVDVGADHAEARARQKRHSDIVRAVAARDHEKRLVEAEEVAPQAPYSVAAQDAGLLHVNVRPQGAAHGILENRQPPHHVLALMIGGVPSKAVGADERGARFVLDGVADLEVIEEREVEGVFDAVKLPAALAGEKLLVFEHVTQEKTPRFLG